MTMTKAVEVMKALNDIDDMELFIDQVTLAYDKTEGNLYDFFHGELMPMLDAELERRKAVLEAM